MLKNNQQNVKTKVIVNQRHKLETGFFTFIESFKIFVSDIKTVTKYTIIAC